MQENFTKSFNYVFSIEGGYVNDPDDDGGPTNFGITLETLREWRGDRSLTASDVKQIKVEEVRQIYKQKYWDPMRCDSLRSGLDYAAFDFAINSGVYRASSLLQTCLDDSKVIDGKITEEIVNKLNDQDFASTLDRFINKRRKYLQGHPKWWKFKGGWTVRVNKVHSRARKMGEETPVSVPKKGLTISIFDVETA